MNNIEDLAKNKFPKDKNFMVQLCLALASWEHLTMGQQFRTERVLEAAQKMLKDRRLERIREIIEKFERGEKVDCDKELIWEFI